MTVEGTSFLYAALILWGCVVMLMTQALTAQTANSMYARYNRSKPVFYTGFAAACLPMAFLLSVRYRTGTDTPVYTERFLDFATIRTFSGFVEKCGEMEPGYVLLNMIVSTLRGNIHVVFAIVSLLIFACMCKGIWNFSGQISSVLMFFILFLLFIPHTFNIMRQMVAVLFVWCALGPMLERNFPKFLFFLVLAFLFHSSAVIMLPFYFASGRGKWCKTAFFCLGGVLIVFYLAYVFMFDKFAFMGQLSSYFIRNGTLKLSVFILRIPFFLPFFFYKRITGLYPQYRIFFLFLIVELIFSSLSNYSPNLYRIALYFRTSWVILLPAMVRSMPTRKWSIAALTIVTVSVTLLFYREFIQLNFGQWIPYQWCLSVQWGMIR